MVVADWGQAFLRAISDAFSKLFSFLPDLIGALLILWIGFFIAKLLGRLVADVLRKIRFNQVAERAGVGRFAQSAGIRQDPSGIMGEIVKWFFRIIALIAAFNVFQLPALTLALTGILDFIPRLLVALVIVLIGGLLANVVADFVQGVAGQSGFSNGKLLSNIARYAILYIAVITALSQLDIAPAIIDTLWIGTIAALALALGLAFGLGGREVAGRILQNSYDKAQQNLPRLSDGVKQQTRQAQRQANSAANTPPQTQTYYNPGQGSAYAASSQTQPLPNQLSQSQPQPGSYQQYGQGYPQPGSTPQQPYNGGYYGSANPHPDQNQPGGNNYPRQ